MVSKGFMAESNNIFLGILGLAKLITGNFAVQESYKEHYFQTGNAEAWTRQGPNGVLAVEVSDLALHVICSDGNATNKEAHVFRTALSSLTTDPFYFWNSGYEDFVIAKRMNQIYGELGLAMPYRKPECLFVAEAFDIAQGTNFATGVRDCLMAIARGAAEANGAPSKKKREVLRLVEVALQPNMTLKRIGEERIPVEPKLATAICEVQPHKETQTETTNEAEVRQSVDILIAELNSLIGLKEVKEDVRKLTDLIRFEQLRREHGMAATGVSLHMVFFGNPGTGKTTVARLLSRIYQALGVVSKGHLVETDRSGLVAGYVGQTALKVREMAEKSRGGILFIDEAYALRRSSDPQDYGNEAIETLLKFMEDNRQDLVVIVAGYPVEMKCFLDANPGLKSRFNKMLNFSDYLPQELMEIFIRFCTQEEFELSASAQTRLLEFFNSAYQNRDLRFGNARLARNIFETTLTNAASRVMREGKTDRFSLKHLEEDDVVAAIQSGQLTSP